MQINRRQQWALKKIVVAAAQRDYGNDNPMKIVKCKVEAIGCRLFVVIEASRPEWKGTLAETLCNRRGIFVVGPSGGIEAKTPDKGKKIKARSSPLIYGFHG